MARILVIDSREDFRDTLAVTLKQRGHVVQVVTTREMASHLQGREMRWDVILIDLVGKRPSDWEGWELIDRIRDANFTDIIKPMFLYIVDGSCQPEMRLDIERRGARLAMIYG